MESGAVLSVGKGVGYAILASGVLALQVWVTGTTIANFARSKSSTPRDD